MIGVNIETSEGVENEFGKHGDLIVLEVDFLNFWDFWVAKQIYFLNYIVGKINLFEFGEFQFLQKCYFVVVPFDAIQLWGLRVFAKLG